MIPTPSVMTSRCCRLIGWSGAAVRHRRPPAAPGTASRSRACRHVRKEIAILGTDGRPDHPTAMGVRPAADGCAQGGIGQELVQRGRQRDRGRGRHEDAAAVGEELACVGVWRGHDGAAGAHRVRHGPGHDLVEVGIWRDEDVRRLEPLRQLDPPDDTDRRIEHGPRAPVWRRLRPGSRGRPRPALRTRSGWVAPTTTYSTDGCAATTSGSAASASSYPLPGPRRPKLRMTLRPSRPRAGLTVTGSTNGSSGTPCGMTCRRLRPTPYALVSRSAADRDMTTVASVLATSSERTAR